MEGATSAASPEPPAAAAASGALQLMDLDDQVLIEICTYLGCDDLLRLQQVCRRCLTVGREPALWQRLLRREFDLAYGAPPSPGHWREQFRAAARAFALPPRRLRFRGAYTDGGCDGGDARYSVESLFSPADWESYCSAASSNVHCVALLEAGEAACDPAELARRRLMLDRCRVAGTLFFPAGARRGPGRRAPGQVGFAPEPDLNRWSRTELESFFVQLFDLAEADHPLGALLVAGVPLERREREMERCADLAAQIRAQRAATAEARTAAAAAARAGGAGGAGSSAADVASDGPDDESADDDGLLGPWVDPSNVLRMFAPRALPRPGQPRVCGVVRQVCVSRVGQFSCPVAAGAVLLGMLPAAAAGRGGAAARRELGALVAGSGALRALDDVASLEGVLEAGQEGRLPPVARVTHVDSGVWVEFTPRGRADATSAAALWPVAWFAFDTREQAAQRAAEDDARAAAAAGSLAGAAAAAGAPAGAAAGALVAQELPDEDRFDKMYMDLTRCHAGDVCCVKLIAAENLMTDWQDDHEEPNIDMNSVALFGAAVTLPPHAS